ncbi:MAG: AAA family ATPase [Terracidiphilus sp.]
MTTFTPAESRRYFESRFPGQRIGSRREAALKCPFHPDRTASMSVNLEEGVWHCHACNFGGGILAFEKRLTGKDDSDCWTAINLTIGREDRKAVKAKRRIIIIYDYRDASGQMVFQVVRYEPKEFRQRRPNGKGGWIWNMNGVTRVLYDLPALVRANVVLVGEGEKDKDILEKAAAEFPDDGGKLCYAATTNVGGALKWLDEYSAFCAGKRVFVFPDNDNTGRNHAQQVCASVSKYAQGVYLVDLPGLAEHEDVSDYLDTHSPLELFALIQSAPKWTPKVTAQPTTTANGFNLVELGELLSRPEVPVDWLVDGMLVRGTVSCAVAKPKVGKGTTARNLCFDVATGAEFLGRKTKKGSCIYLALEERSEEVTADFRAMGADGTEPILIHADTTPETAIPLLVVLVREQRPALLVIDPLIRMVRVRDEKAYAEMYTGLGPLIDVAREVGTHILLVHHSGKSVKSDAIDSPLGSTAIGAAVSTLIVLKRTESYRSIQTVQRIGIDMPETVLTFDSKTRLLSIGGTRAEADRREIEKDIVEYLQSVNETLTEPEIIDHIEGTNAVKRKALRSLVDNQTIHRDGGGKKGDPFKYSFACTEDIPRTSVQETENEPQTRMDIEEKVVRENQQGPILVRDKSKAQIQTIGGLLV